jgi:hypothetical protein
VAGSGLCKSTQSPFGHSAGPCGTAAPRCGLDRTYVGGIERGHRNITLVSLMRLAAGLQAPVSALTEPLDEFLGLPE